MEGVLVSARKDGSNITVTVVSDQGAYAFPAGRLDPGHYTIAIRAGGYNLDGPTAVDVAPTAPRPTSSWSRRRASPTSSPTRNGCSDI